MILTRQIYEINSKLALLKAQISNLSPFFPVFPLKTPPPGTSSFIFSKNVALFNYVSHKNRRSPISFEGTMTYWQ